MDHQYRPEPVSSTSQEFYSRSYSRDDEAMGGTEENVSTTPTTGYSSSRHQSSQSSDFPPSNGNFSPHADSDPNARYPSPNMSYQQHPTQPVSRPSSGLSGSGDRYGHSQTYQEQNQRSAQQAAEARTQSSVVIKVGMVGDAQIGKTSLMVKYVEGSWDEDYIQTLGSEKKLRLICWLS